MEIVYARSLASAAVELSHAYPYKIPRFRSPAFLDSFTLKMGPIGSTETSVSNHPTPRNSLDDRRIQLRGAYFQTP